MSAKTLTLMAVGDIILGPETDAYFDDVRSTLKTSDVMVGQLEVTHSDKDPKSIELGRDLKALAILPEVGFHVLTLAGNHVHDAGPEAIQDTISWLNSHHISPAGAGMNLAEARRPVVIERDGTRFGFLSFNCVGPNETWATADKAGAAYVHILTHYELDHANPGGPPSIYTWAEPDSLKNMLENIRHLRPLCDILVVSFHKGLVHTPIKLAHYEQQISYAAIDAGADLILGHHSHILKGIEQYKGKTIFHCLGNFVTYLPILALKPGQDPKSWARRRIELFGFVPDPDYPTYPFHPDAIYTIIAKCQIRNKKISKVSYIPLIVNKKGHPEIVRHDERGQRTFDYMEKISASMGLDAHFQWDGDEVLIS
jgi:hypothetical protein